LYSENFSDEKRRRMHYYVPQMCDNMILPKEYAQERAHDKLEKDWKWAC
jgi:hypothetical protein